MPSADHLAKRWQKKKNQSCCVYRVEMPTYHKVFVALWAMCRFLKDELESSQSLAFCMVDFRTSFLCKKFSTESSLIYIWGYRGLGRCKSLGVIPPGKDKLCCLQSRLYTHELLRAWLCLQGPKKTSQKLVFKASDLSITPAESCPWIFRCKKAFFLFSSPILRL